VSRPLGTWLADNEWFGLKVRQAVIEEEHQWEQSKRSRKFESDVTASIHPENEEEEEGAYVELH